MKDSNPISTRDRILNAAEKLLSTAGYKKMTIDAIASSAGIGKGSVYLHFTSKEEIALSHIDRIIEKVKSRLTEIADSREPYSERLAEMLVQRVLLRFDSVQHYTQSLNDMLAKIRPQLLERRRRYFDEESKIVARVIEEGIKHGDFEKGSPEDIAASLLTATNSLLPVSLTARELGERGEIEARARAVSRILLNGLLARDKVNR